MGYMDDALIHKILIAIPSLKWVSIESMSVDGITDNMLQELCQLGLLDTAQYEMPGNKKHYRRTDAGNAWLLDYPIRQRLEEHQRRIEEHQRRIEILESRNLMWSALAVLLSAIVVFQFFR